MSQQIKTMIHVLLLFACGAVFYFSRIFVFGRDSKQLCKIASAGCTGKENPDGPSTFDLLRFVFPRSRASGRTTFTLYHEHHRTNYRESG